MAPGWRQAKPRAIQCLTPESLTPLARYGLARYGPSDQTGDQHVASLGRTMAWQDHGDRNDGLGLQPAAESV